MMKFVNNCRGSNYFVSCGKRVKFYKIQKVITVTNKLESKKKYLFLTSKYFNQNLGDQIRLLFCTPKSVRCNNSMACDSNIGIDQLNYNMYCYDKCRTILGYDLGNYMYTVENIRGKYYKRGVYKKPSTPKTVKVLAKLGIQTTGCDMLSIKYKLNQILKGKILR